MTPAPAASRLVREHLLHRRGRLTDTRAMDATVHRPGEGETLGDPATVSVTIKADGEETGGSFYLGESTIQPGFPGPPPHRHERLHDMFYVLDGTLTMLLGDESLELEAGSFVCVPPGVVHTFSNPGDAPVRVLNFNTPAGWEHYMRELGAMLASGSPTQAEIGRVASKYDFRVA
jgi:mannose-6-phosphate isomerase-like protein (cupin superfamily)